MQRRINSLPLGIALLALAAGTVTCLLSVTGGPQGRGVRSAPAAPRVATLTRAGSRTESLSNEPRPTEEGPTGGGVQEDWSPRVPARTLARLFEAPSIRATPPASSPVRESLPPARPSQWRHVATAVTAHDRKVYLFVGEVAGRVLALAEGEKSDGWRIERIEEGSVILTDGRRHYQVQQTASH